MSRQRGSERMVSPPPGVVVGDQRAAHRLGEAARDGEAEADAAAAPRSSRRWNGAKMRSRCSGGTPGPWSTTSSLALSAAGGRASPRRAVLAAVPEGVVDQVGEHPLEQPGSAWTSGRSSGDVERHPLGRARDGEHRGADDLVERDGRGVGR